MRILSPQASYSDPHFSPTFWTLRSAFPKLLDLERAEVVLRGLRGVQLEEARNTQFCPSQKKFHTFVLRGLSNISEAP